MSTDLSPASTDVLDGVAEDDDDIYYDNQNTVLVERDDLFGVSGRDVAIEDPPRHRPEAAPPGQGSGNDSELTSETEESGESLPSPDVSFGKRKRDQEEEDEWDELVAPPEIITISKHLTQYMNQSRLTLKRAMLEGIASVLGFKHPIKTSLRLRLMVIDGSGQWHHKDTALSVYRYHRGPRSVYPGFLGGCQFLKERLGIDRGDDLGLTYLGAAKYEEAVHEDLEIIDSPRGNSLSNAQGDNDDSMDKIGVEESLSELALVAPPPGCRLHHDLDVSWDITKTDLYFERSMLKELFTNTLGLEPDILNDKGKRIPCKVLAILEGKVELQELCDIIVGPSGGGYLNRGKVILNAMKVKRGGRVRFTYLGHKEDSTKGRAGNKVYHFKLEDISNFPESLMETPQLARGEPVQDSTSDFASPRRITRYAGANHLQLPSQEPRRSHSKAASLAKLPGGKRGRKKAVLPPQPLAARHNPARLARVDSGSRELSQNLKSSLDVLGVKKITPVAREAGAGGKDEARKLPQSKKARPADKELDNEQRGAPLGRSNAKLRDFNPEKDTPGAIAQPGGPRLAQQGDSQHVHHDDSGSSGRNARAVPIPPATVPLAARRSVSLAPLLKVACAKSINAAEREMMDDYIAVSGAAGGSAAVPSAQAQQAPQLYSIIMGSVQSKKAIEAVEGNNVFIQNGPDSLQGFEYCDRSRWCASEIPSVDATLLSKLYSVGARYSPSLASVLQGKAAFKLWLGRVQAGEDTNACFGVVALDDIPAGSWIMQWTGDYAMGHNVRHQGLSRAVTVLQDAVVPVHAAITKAQQAQCAGLPTPSKFKADENKHWKSLPRTSVDSRCRGNAVRFVRLSDDPNVGRKEIDLPTGPTGVFLFAMRDIAKGEELNMLS